ncbi:MAG TPA: hypothetical protein VG166_03300 [Caulobacteraceae bacterium]|jgi:antitoxin (DNA-binding transcriptional repressor) of toxin-antitoxin stability system|nr:hypothetical protein [Caulobacteraceae bacterium]
MLTAQTYTATEFKAKCLDILDRLAARKIGLVTITKRGKVVALVTPPERDEAAVRGLHGLLRGAVVTSEDVDFTAPVLDQPLEAERGHLHE